MFVQRPGGQSQFSSHLRAQVAEREPLRELQEWMAANLDADLSVPALAERACMSERNFARAFGREVGMTPGAYVEALRVDHARLRLESTGQKLAAVARDCGFGTVETMRRAFHRRLGVGPGRLPRQVPDATRRSQMQIAIPLFDRLTALDAVGPYEVLSRLPGARVDFVAAEPGVYHTDTRMLGLTATLSYDDAPHPDVLVFPGGFGTRALMHDEPTLDWVRQVHETSRFTTSVCTGALVLGAAGVLDGLEATTHWLSARCSRSSARRRSSGAWWSRARW